MRDIAGTEVEHKYEELVSIITPMYNCEKYVEDMIKSVINQTYFNWELIIIDDCSTDNSIKIVEDIMKFEPRILLIKHFENLGPAEARNTGIRKAKGKFIAYLDSDDLWHKEKLKVQIDYMKNKNAATTCTSYGIISESDKNFYNEFIVPPVIRYKDLLKRNYFSCDTVIINRTMIEDIYMESAPQNEDYITWLKIIKQVKVAYGIPRVLAQYRMSNISRSSNKFAGAFNRWKIYRVKERLSWTSSLYYIVHYCIGGLIKYRGRFKLTK
jgi:teichuronic acid biosynthesis glycosyltransferase TuaG